MTEITEKIGYYKYISTNPNIADCVREYPITKEILEYINKTGLFRIECQDSEPKKINGKLVALI